MRSPATTATSSPFRDGSISLFQRCKSYPREPSDRHGGHCRWPQRDDFSAADKPHQCHYGRANKLCHRSVVGKSQGSDSAVLEDGRCHPYVRLAGCGRARLSCATVQKFDVSLVPATTPSLEGLKAYAGGCRSSEHRIRACDHAFSVCFCGEHLLTMGWC
jgi:hypothetical protein